MTNVSTPTALFLDIGNVLLSNGWDRALRRQAAETFHLDLEELNERHHLTYDTYEAGKLSLDAYLERVVFYQPRPFRTEAFKAFIFEHSRAFPQMIRLVRNLKDRYRLKLVAISNEGRELMEYRIQHHGLTRFIDVFIGSCFVHLRKPDLDLYRLALDVAQVPSEDVVYIDDRPMFVQAAESLGIPGIVHESYTTTAAALKGVGLA